MLFREIVSYGSCKHGVITANSKSMIMTSIYAQTMAEKGQYLPTSQISAISNLATGEEEKVGVAFWPQLLLGIQTPVPSTAQNTFGVSYAAEVAFDLTFRGVRFDDN